MASEVEWIVERERFLAIADAWDALALPEPDPFQRHVWFACWWGTYATGDVRVAVVWRDGELVAGLPLTLEDRTATMLGWPVMAPLRPLARDDEALTQLAHAVRELPVTNVTLHSALEQDPTTAAFARALGWRFPLRGRSHRDRFLSVETTGTYADYRAEMKSRWGSIERKGRKLARDHEAELRIVEPPVDLPVQLEAGLALEAQGWKGRAGTAMTDNAAAAAFHRAIAYGFAQSGDLRLSEILLDGRLVAWDLAVLHGGRLHSMKTTYAEDVSTLSPGLVLRRAIVERCFELGLDGHELLGIDMGWKRRFATSGRASTTLRIDRVRPRPLARLAYERLARPTVVRVRARRRASADERWPPPPLRAP